MEAFTSKLNTVLLKNLGYERSRKISNGLKGSTEDFEDHDPSFLANIVNVQVTCVESDELTANSKDFSQIKG